MFSKGRFLLLLCTALALSVLLVRRAEATEKREHGNLLIRWFKAQEYRGSEQNWAIVQDSRGLLYVGNNEGGVLEYDGERWRRIAVPDNRIVRSLSVGATGIVYAGLVGDFGCLVPDHRGLLQYVSLRKKLAEEIDNFGDVYKTYSFGNTIYFCTSNYIFSYDELERSVHAHRIPPLHIFLSFHLGDQLGVTSFSDTLLCFSGKQFEKQVLSFPDDVKERQIYGMLPLSGDTVLMAMNTSHFYYLLRNTGEVKEVKSGWGGATLRYLQTEEAIPYVLKRCPNGNIGIGFIFSEDIAYMEVTPSGRVEFVAGLGSGLADPYAMDLLHSSDGSLWLTQNNGITKIEQQAAVRKFDESNGINGAVLDVQRFDGELYIGTMSGVQKLVERNGLWKFESIPGINQPVWDLLPYYNPQTGGRTLVALGMYAIYSLRNGQLTQFATSDKDVQFGGFVLCDTKADARTLYVGTPTGIVALHLESSGVWTKRAFFAKDINDEVRSLVMDLNNTLWVGTLTNGVYVVRNVDSDHSELRHIDEHCGLPTMVNNEVFFLNENVYVGTEKGLMRYDWNQDTLVRVDADAKPQYLSRIAGLRNRVVVQRYNAETEEYYISMGLVDGRGQISGDETHPFARFPKQWCDKIYWDDDNSLWFAYANRLFNYDFSIKRDYERPFRVFVRKVHAVRADTVLFGGTHFAIQDSIYRILADQTETPELRLPYRENSLNFEVGVDFFEGEGVEYSYRLRNSGDDWTKWENKPEIRYMNIAPGNYEFQVRARNLYQVESNVATFKFVVNPPFYRTIWAYIVYVLLLVGLVYLIIRLNMRRVMAEKLRLEKLVDERTAEVVAQKEHIEEQNKEIINSINYASKIQRAVLPTPEMVKELFPDSFLLFLPRDVVSGDFYWMRAVGKKKICVIADCTGHGVPGGFMSMLGATFLDQVVNSLPELHTDEILNRLRAAVIKKLRQTDQIGSNKDGMDLALYILDEERRTVEFSGANNPLIIIRNGEVLQYKGDKMPIAIYLKGDLPFTRTEIELQPGDVLYTFSDGYEDQFGGLQNRKFMIKRLKELLAEIAPQDVTVQREILHRTLIDWQGSYSRTDDVIVFGLRIH